MFSLSQSNKKFIRVKLPNKIQDIYIGSGIKNIAIEEIIKRDYSAVIVFVDKNVSKIEKGFINNLRKELPTQEVIEVDAGEQTKSVEFLNFALEKCIRHKLNRKSCIVAYGGGIVGDAAGFLASVYMRGIDMVFLPTTLMAQGDTIINKVALSYRFLKNVFGSFYSPVLTVCDTNSLPTLPIREISLGLSEIIKHGLIRSEKFVNKLEKVIKQDLKDWEAYPWNDIIYESLKIKSDLVSKDPNDLLGYHKGLSFVSLQTMQ